MKPIFVTILLGGLALTGCSEDIANELFGNRTPVSVTAEVEAPQMGLTRASTLLTLNSNSGFTISENTAFNKVNVNIDGDDYVYTFRGTAGEASRQLILDDAQPYFPIGETSVKVFARYPDYADDISTNEGQQYFTIQQDQTTTDAYLRSDLMTAAATNATRTKLANGAWNVTEASLTFRHQMTKLMVTADTEEGSGLTIKSVKINGIKPRVSVTKGENGYIVGSAITDSEGKSYDVVVMEEAASGTVVIPPQTIAPTDDETQQTFMTVVVDYKNTQTGEDVKNIPLTYYFTGTGKTFAPNQVYTINVIVGNDTYELWKANGKKGVDISEWNAADLTNINIYPTVVHTSLRTDGELVLLQNGTEVESITKTYTGNMITLKAYNPSDPTDPVTREQAEMAVKVKGDDAAVNYIIKNGNYAITYSDNVDQGTATVTVVGIGSYSGTLQRTFTIEPKSLSGASIQDIPDESYDGYPHRPAVNVTVGGRALFLDTDFTLDYGEDNTNAGEKTITINGINNYQGTVTTQFTISKVRGSYTFADTAPETAPMRFYKQTTYTETVTYKNALTAITGNGSVTSATSSDESVATVTSDGTVTIVGAGTTEITLNLTSTNYEYDSYHYWIKVTSGPVLPIMYVASANLGNIVNGSFAFAENQWSTNSAFFTWESVSAVGYDLNTLKDEGFTHNGVSYHLPSLSEWESIFPTNSTITFNTAGSFSDVSDELATFSSDNTPIGGTSDYKSLGTGTAYGLRFKGTEYCCAYRYDRMDTTLENQHLTGNSFGRPSLVIRVIYLGQRTEETIEKISGWGDDKWNDEYDVIVTLPCCGYFFGGGGDSGDIAYSTEDTSYYAISDDPTSFLYFSTVNVRTVVASTTTIQGVAVRLFRDSY